MVKENKPEMLNARRPHFFDVFSSNLSAERLKIPTKFIRHLEGRSSGSVLLIGPGGNTCRVSLIQRDDDLFFHQGWPTFVRDHFIECGDLLVFRYDGELHFTVQVFDQSACEKEAAFHSECSQGPSTFDKNTGQKREREEAAASLDKVIEGAPKKIRGSSSGFHSECIERHQEGNSFEKTNHCGSPPKNFVNPSQSKAFDEKPEAAIQKRTSKEEGLNVDDGSCMLRFSEREEKKIAQSFTSCFPHFVRIMKRFNISGSYTLNIPYQFSMEHLPKCKTEIVLHNLKGASWTVNSVPTTRVHTSHTFCGGWMAFVRSNEIKLGDICIFELVRKCELRVHILPDGNEDSDNQSGKIAPNGLHAGSDVLSHKNFEGLPKKVSKNSSKVHLKCVKNVQLCDKKGSKMRDRKKHLSATKKSAIALCALSRIGNEKPGAVIQNRNNIGAEQVRGGLRMMVALDEEKAARSFSSGFPHFVRIMRKFNISGSYTLKIPHRFSTGHLPDCKTEIVLRNLQGECWTVNSVPDSKGRMVHTFCGGWMAFVRENDIQMGDICIFELVSTCEMRVHISGVGRIGLDHQGGKPASSELLVGSSAGDHPPLRGI